MFGAAIESSEFIVINLDSILIWAPNNHDVHWHTGSDQCAFMILSG